MTQRERHTPDSGVPAPPGRTSPAGAGLGCVWEELFQAAAPGRQQQLLALAGRQGMLYAHDLPLAGCGPAKRPLLAGLLNGQLHDLSPLRPAAVECMDACLDEAQRDAVARALQTPDLCLIQGYPGSGKSRTAAEIVARAAARGERVLFLAPTTGAVDCVLERLDGRDGLCAVRCLSVDETPESLPPWLRRLTFEERVRSFHEQTLPAAKAAAAEAGRRLDLRRKDEGVWSGLEEVARRLEALAGETRQLIDGEKRLEAEGEAALADGSSPLSPELARPRAERDEALARIDARLAELSAEAEKVRGQLRSIAEEVGQIRPLVEAMHGGRWWTSTWWRARRDGDLPHRLEQLEKQQGDLAAASLRLTQESEERTAERAASEARYEEEVAQLRRREAERRRAERDERRKTLAHEQASLEEQGRTAGRGLSGGVAPPGDLSVAAVLEGREAWRRLLMEEERQAAETAQWAEVLEQSLATLPERLARCVNVVGASTSALAGNPHFGDHASSRLTFDLLVLEEAHLVTESEFLAAARRARRWVLIGEPTDEAPPVPSHRLARPSTLRPGFFQRLWRLLHSDPSYLPYAWFHRDGRLVCRLRTASPDEERWIESEYLADRPEIELRFVAPPRTAPRLLEVLFPGATTVQEAKGFIFRELGELPVQARGGCFRWRDDAARLVLDLSHRAVPDALAVELAEGVREHVVAAVPGDDGACWRTCSLEFDRAAGWTSERAEQWVEEHLRTRDLGRTALLNEPHRCRPALARFLSGLLFEGACLPDGGEDEAPAVAFVPVPSLENESARRREEEGRGRRGGTATIAPRLRASRGGAGLEIDLADPRRLDPLSADLRAALPRQGLVNLFEAQAVVRRLECLAADPGFRAAAEEWARDGFRPPARPGTACGSAACHCSTAPGVGRRPALAAMALYPAQVELIRLLAAQSPALAAAPVAVEIDAPDAFRQRECFTALVSLTRSHSHRAVPFGGDPALLATALTRAASRLVLFGDPGTLSRRCQWNGPVEHLDGWAAECERGRIGQLVAYLHGQGPHPATFCLDESGGV